MNVSILNHSAWNCAKVFATEKAAEDFMLDCYYSDSGEDRNMRYREDVIGELLEGGDWSLEDGELMFEVKP